MPILTRTFSTVHVARKVRNRRPIVRLALTAVFAMVTVGTPLASATTGTLPPAVKAELDRAGIPPGNVSVWVQSVDATAPSLAVNADTPMNPASVMKLVTAFVALEQWGAAQTWETRIETTGTLRDGVLDGSLFLRGGGDPLLSVERTWKVLRQVRALGIDRIKGDIVLDGSVLALPTHDPDAFDGRGLRPYNSGPHGMLLHFNTLNLTLIPGRGEGEAVTVVASPPLDGLRIDNRIRTAGGACGTWFAKLESSLERQAEGPRLVLSGALPASCGRRDWGASPLAPEAFGVAMIRGLWTEVGGRLEGQVRAGITPAGSKLLLVETSPPLADMVREMNKWSSNVIARQLLAMLGRDAGAAVGRLDAVAGGVLAAGERLTAAGLDIAGLVIENGSGLSRIERIRASTLGQMLVAAWRRPYMPEFIAALPVAGIDGTARRRLSDSPARGQAHIKTGTINNVRAIAGYVLDRHGRRHAVVMMVNHANAADSRAAQDVLLEWVWAATD